MRRTSHSSPAYHDGEVVGLRLGVKGAWVLENLRRLGSGAFYHLAYATHHVHPQLMNRLKTRSPVEGRVEIYWLTPDRTAVRFATGEVIAVHWFPEFVRIHFMIVSVLTPDEEGFIEWESDHLVLPAARD